MTEEIGDKELEAITGFNSVQFRVAKDKLLQHINNVVGAYSPYYFAGFAQDNKQLKIKSEKVQKVCFYASLINNGVINFNRFGDNVTISLIKEPLGNFTLITDFKQGRKSKQVIENYTKSGTKKPGSYIPNQQTNNAIIQNYNKEKTQILKRNISNIENIDLIKNLDKTLVAELMYKLSVQDIEYAVNKPNIFYIKGNNCEYRLNINPLSKDQKTYVGIATKILQNGDCQTYIVKVEQVLTNKSIKLVFSTLPAVQMGLDDNSPTQEKYLRETKESGKNTTTTNNNVNVQATSPFIENLFGGKTYYDGDISQQNVKELNRIVTECIPEKKRVHIVSKSQ